MWDRRSSVGIATQSTGAAIVPFFVTVPFFADLYVYSSNQLTKAPFLFGKPITGCLTVIGTKTQTTSPGYFIPSLRMDGDFVKGVMQLNATKMSMISPLTNIPAGKIFGRRWA